MTTLAPSVIASHTRPRREPRLNNLTATPNADEKRDSNALRASVFETALEIGFGSNTTVANWIFNNPLTEEDESEEVGNFSRLFLFDIAITSRLC
jgi:hypothetical protein